MEDLTASHIVNNCARCSYSRLTGGENFICSLFYNQTEEGVSTLLTIKDTHHNVDIDNPICEGRTNMVGLPEVINEISANARNFSRGMIGFSTGCLYKTNLSLVDKLKIYLRAGSTVLELSFATPQDLLNFELTEAVASKLRKFSKVTIHAPWKDIKYFDGSNVTSQVIDKIIQLSDILNTKEHVYISGVVFHPDIISNFSALEMVPIPALIENMDINKQYGISVEEIAKIKQDYDFDFILDVQHAYEHDPSLTLAHELISAMGDRIRHLHVSGENQDNRHVPVYLADNKVAICSLLKVLPSVPVVLEGVISGNLSTSAKAEIAYVTEHGNPLVK